MAKIRVNHINVLADTKYLKMYDAEYSNKNGEARNWTIASRKDLIAIKNKFFNSAEDDIDAVIITAVHVDDNKLVIIKQFRVPINDYVYELPAGLIDEGEDFETTVKRELKEETGLDLICIDYNKSKRKTYVSTGMTDESVALIYCTCSGEISKDYLEPDEDIETVLLSKEEAVELIHSNEKIDIKALFAIQNYILQ